MDIHAPIAPLEQQFLASAFVRDPVKGYLVVEPFNLAIDPQILESISQTWAEHFRSARIDAVAGLPDAGSRLSALISHFLRVAHILPSKRALTAPGAWSNVVTYQNQSFTTGQADVRSHIGFVKAGTRVLLVDDVVAYGDTAVAAIQALQAAGAVVVGLAVIFDKVWQGGVERIQKETGVETFSIIRVQAISPDKKITLAPHPTNI